MGKKLRDEDLVLNIIINGNKGKKEMNELDRSIKDTTTDIRKLEKAQKDLRDQGKQNTDQYKTLTFAIQEKNKAVHLAESRLTQLRKGMKLTEMSLADLRKEQQRLNQLWQTSNPGSENQKQFKAQLDAVNNRMTELRGNAETTGSSLSRMASKFNHYFTMITAGVLTVAAGITGIKKVIDAYAEFDDKLADVMKTTGMTKGEVKELNEELKKIDTRTQQLDLLGLARVAGKLGYTSKKDIEGFVRATDQIGVALSEDLGGDVEESVNQLGKLVDIFKLEDQFGIEKSLLKVGSAINELGASSTANEAYLVEFSRRMAGVAPLAGISIQQVLGLGATLDSLGQTSEVSSTALSQLFVKMASDSGKFAKYAGMSAAEFKKNLERDFMGTFVKMLEGVKQSAGGINELAGTLGDMGLEGGRVIGVLGSLANNTEALKTQVNLSNAAFAQGTSLTNEYSIKNNTAAASLEKARKGLYNLTVELGEKLYPVMTMSLSGFSLFVKILSSLTTFLINNYKWIITTAAGLAAYNVALLVSNNLTRESIIMKRAEAVLAKLKVFWDTAQTASMHLLSAAYLVAKGNIAAAKWEMAAFNAVTKMNPLAALIGLLVAVTVGLIAYSGKLSDAEKAAKTLMEAEDEANKSVADQKVKVEQLLKVARDKTRSDQDRADAIRQLNELSPEYLGFLNLENINTAKATEATDAYILSLLKVARVKAAQDKLVEIEKKKIDLMSGKGGAELNWMQQGFADVVGTVNQNAGISLKENFKNNNTNTEFNSLNSEQAQIEAYINKNTTSAVVKDTPLDILNKKLEVLKAELKGAKEGSKEYIKIQKDIANTEKEINKINGVVVTGGGSEKDRDAAKKIAADALKDFEQLGESYKKLGTSRFLDQLTQNQKEIEQEKLKYNTLIEEGKAFLKQKGTTAEQRKSVEAENAKLEKERDASVAQIKIRQEADLNKKISDFRKGLNEVVKTELEKERELINKHYDALELENAGNDAVLAQLRLERQKDLSGAEIHEKERLEKEKKLIEDKYKPNESQRDKDLAEINAKYDGEIEALKTKYSKELQVTQEFQDMIAAINARRVEDVNSLETKDTEVKAEFQMKMAQLASDTSFTILANSRQRQSDMVIANINRQKEAELSSRDMTDRERVAIEAKYAKRIRDEKLKAFKADKVMAIAQATINGAIAVTMALRQTGVLSPFVIPGIVASTLAQIAVIASQKPPVEADGYEEGGYLDVKRKQDGKKFRAQDHGERRGYFNKPSVLVSENGQEFVASAQAVRNDSVRPFLDMIDSAQRNGTINTLNMERMFSKPISSGIMPGREDGGYLSSNRTSSISSMPGSLTDTQMLDMLKQNAIILQQLQVRLSQPIEASVNLLGKSGFIEKQKELTQIQELGNL